MYTGMKKVMKKASEKNIFLHKIPQNGKIKTKTPPYSNLKHLFVKLIHSAILISERFK